MTKITINKKTFNQLNKFSDFKIKIIITKRENKNDWRKATFTELKAISFFKAINLTKNPLKAAVPLKAANKAKKNKENPSQLVLVGSTKLATKIKIAQQKMVKTVMTYKYFFRVIDYQLL